MTTDTQIQPQILPFFEKESSTFSYVIRDPNSNYCAIIDSVLDFDYASGTVSYDSADEIIEYIRANKLNLTWIIETHVHADHLSAAPYIKEKLGGKIGIGKDISTVQRVFFEIFNEDKSHQPDGSQFDHLFDDQETYFVGELTCKAIHTPGHTPACMTHVMGDAVFVGDTLFMPDAGTARADFPGGDASVLYDSIDKILSLPDDTRIFMCHDYRPNGRELEYQTTVGKQKKNNIHVKQGISKSTFVEMRETRDKTLDMPRLILPSLQVNMHAGNLPDGDTNGTPYLKIPINAFSK